MHGNWDSTWSSHLRGVTKERSVSHRANQLNVSESRTSVRDISELAFPIVVDEIWEKVLLHEVGVKLGDTVDFLAADDCEISHSDLLGETLYAVACHSWRYQNR